LVFVIPIHNRHALVLCIIIAMTVRKIEQVKRWAVENHVDAYAMCVSPSGECTRRHRDS
jgi:hypothetical protein